MSEFPDASQELRVPILIEETAGVARRSEPIRLGIPLARGQLYEASKAVIVDGDDRVCPHQWRVLARWPDRSLKWLLMDSLVAVAPLQKQTLFLRPARTEQETRYTYDSILEVEVQAGAIKVSTGVATFCVGGERGTLLESVSRAGVRMLKGGARLCLRGVSGREYVAVIERIIVEESGLLRTAVTADGYFVSGNRKSPLAFNARFIFVAGSARLRLELKVHNPRAASHPGGLWDLNDRGTVLFEDLSLALAPAETARELRWYAERPEEEHAAAPDGWVLYQDSSGGENWDSDNHVDGKGNSTVTFRGYRVTCRDSTGEMLIAEGDRATPCLCVGTHVGTLAVTTLDFWQNFPKALRWSEGSLSISLFPGECRTSYALQGGEQKRHTTLLEFLVADEASSIPEAQHPLRAWVDASAVERSGVIEGFVPASRDPNGGYQRYVNTIIDGSHSFDTKRELIDEYGWRHFGDLYADHEAVNHPGPRALVSHYNNQYDFIYGGLVHFLRSGDHRWYALAEDAARHTIDIDIYHTDRDKAAFNHGLFWHTDHYKPAATCTHRTYSRRNGKSRLYGGGPSNEHNYTSGLLLYYYLSGDPEAACAVRELGDWVIAMDDGTRSILGMIDAGPTGLASKTVDPMYHKAGRGAGNSINALLDTYVLSGERRLLDKAEALIRRCIHPSDDIDALRLSEPELRWSYLVFLQALGKYLYLKLEWKEADYMFHYGRASLLHYARWMSKYEVPYKQMLSRVVLPTETWPAHDVRKCHVLHLAAELASGSERAVLRARANFFFDRCLADVLSFDTAFLARPRVILCVSGHVHAYYQLNSGTQAAVEGASYSFGRPEAFTPQRQRWRAGLPAKMRVLAVQLARLGIERLGLLGRRSTPSRI